ncbi:MAG: hypothetical protein FWE35_18720 [Streptosporangiales bacterium]|jgi:hypothetical protein|nr:hypothetical protein [Streptosporangiales bacterium]
MNDDRLRALSRTRLNALQSAVGTLLDVAEEGVLTDPLESELYELRSRLIAALTPW